MNHDPGLSTPNRRSRRSPLTNRGVAVVAAASVLAGGVVGVNVNNRLNDARTDQTQPECALEVRPGDSLWGIMDRLNNAGDSGRKMRVFDPAGNERKTLYGGRDGAPMLDSIQPEDIAIIERVDPQVCSAVGGVSLNDVIDAPSSPATESPIQVRSEELPRTG